MRDGRIDIVHGLGASVLGYARRRATSTAPLVLNPQGLEEFGATSPGRARLKRAGYLPLRRAVLLCARAADRIIATDRALEPVVRQHLDVQPERIRVIPNALDLRWLDGLATPGDGARVRLAAGIGRDDVVLLSVGRLEENKGFHLLAAALGALAAHGGRLPEGRWRWVVIGEGPFRGRLEEAIREANLGTRGDARRPRRGRDCTRGTRPPRSSSTRRSTRAARSSRSKPWRTAAPSSRPTPAACLTRCRGERLARRAGGCVGARGGDQRSDRRTEKLAAFGQAGRRIVEDEFSWDAAGRATLALYKELLA